MLKIAWSPEYAYPLPKGHRFPMEKYELLPEQLLYEGTVVPSNFFSPEKISEELVLSTHNSIYWEKLKKLTLSRSEIRATGFPLSKRLVERELLIAGGSIRAAEYAIDYKIAMNVAGGTHHAYADRGEGFCLLNDIALTSNYLINNGLTQKVLVVDLDVHQGNGTAAIFKDRQDVFTFSMHGEKNYPHRKEYSSLDVGLPDGIGDKEYLQLLRRNLSIILSEFQPEFIIYQSGVDVLESDKLGRLKLSMDGIRERDRQVLEFAREIKVPIMCCMGGGYSKKIGHIIEAHAQVYRLAQEMFF